MKTWHLCSDITDFLLGFDSITVTRNDRYISYFPTRCTKADTKSRKTNKKTDITELFYAVVLALIDSLKIPFHPCLPYRRPLEKTKRRMLESASFVVSPLRTAAHASSSSFFLRFWRFNDHSFSSCQK